MTKRKRYGAEQIIGMLREAEVELAKGKTVQAVARKLGITEQSYYRWRRRYGGLKTEHAKRYRELEKENARLKRLVADLALDNSILKEVARPNF
jgi:transposase-like protein